MSNNIAASIVTFKTDIKEFFYCLNSLLHDNVERIYVCDNSPNDLLRNFCKMSNSISYIHMEKNIGYGRAHNIAIRLSLQEGFKYHLVINPDVYFEQGTIERIVEFMDSDEGTVQLTPNVIYPDGRVQFACRMLPTPCDLILRRFMPSFLFKKRENRYLLKFFDRKSCVDIPYHMGCFMFFRCSAFEKAGLFDERFFMYPEDIDMTRRMHRIGKTLFWPGATVVHAHRAASYKSFRMLWIHIVNMIRYFNKWGWFCDMERKVFNMKLLSDLGYNEKTR